MARAIITLSETDPAGWGAVPTIGGDVTTSVPDPITGVSATQTTQSSTATTQAIQQEVFLPPAPTWSPLLDSTGGMTPPWIVWFQTLNRKLGGYNATPSDDAEILAYEPTAPAIDPAMALLGAFDVPTVPQQATQELWEDSSIGWVKGQKYQATTVSVLAGAPLTAGQWCNLYNDAGTMKVRPADSTDNTKPAQGFVLTSYASSSTATVYLAGVNTAVPVGSYVAADVGKAVFLSTSGGTTLTPPSTTGNLLQQVGWVDAVGSAVTVNFINSPGITRA